MRQITPLDLDVLSTTAATSPRRRTNLNIHEDLEDPVQRLAIAMEPDTLVLPHRHPHTWEILFPLRGQFIVLLLDDTGVVTQRRVLGDDTRLIEIPAGQWHAVLSKNPGGVIFEVKRGPYTPLVPADLLGTTIKPQRLLDWYHCALPGDRLAEADQR